VSHERYLISAVLRGNSYADAVGYELAPEMFETYPKEWSWLLEYMNKYRRVPPKGSFRQAFPDFSIAMVDDGAHQADLVRQNYANRQLKEHLTQVAQQVKNGSVDAALLQMQKAILSTATTLGTVPDSDVMQGGEDVLAEVEVFHDRIVETGFAGVPTGFKTWDVATGGCKPGEFIVVGARLGSGKSWILAKMASSALLEGHTVLYDSLEMTRTNITLRVQTVLAQAVGQPYPAADILTGSSVPDLPGYRLIRDYLREKVPGLLHVADTTRGSISPMTVAAQIERIQPDIVFIDYLTLLEMSGEGDWKSVASLSKSIQRLAQRYKIPIVAASQLNRAQGLTRGVPGNEAMAYSDAIGQDADQIMNLQTKSKRVIQQKLTKNRHGAGGMSWYSEFRPGAGVIEEISPDRAYELIDDDEAEA
jgi:replicative DNA helicase